MTHSLLQRDLPAWPGGWGSAWGGLRRSTAATAKSGMCMEDGMCPCGHSAPSPGKSGERRWCKMTLSTGDFSVGFTRVLHDGWKGGSDEISPGELCLDGCSFMLLVGKPPPFRADQLQVPALGSWKADRRALERRQ